MKHSLFCVVVTLLALGARAQTPTAADPVMAALEAELARSVDGLKLDGVERPYFILYAVNDTDSQRIDASFGAVRNNSRDRIRTLRTEVRVGSHDLDNTGFTGGRFPLFMPRFLPLEDDAMALRHEIWLATDEAYKSAAELLAQKKGVLAGRVEPDRPPDFSCEEPSVSIGSRHNARQLDAGWVDRIKRLSALFRAYPAVQESWVSLFASATNTFLVSSEGSRILQTNQLGHLWFRASVQAPNGAVLSLEKGLWELDLAGLPGEEQIVGEIRRFAEEMSALASAPAAENYSGPVLFVEQAAPALFGDLLEPHLRGSRPPLTPQPLPAALATESDLASKLGRAVLPDFLDVVDDPLSGRWNGEALVGGYAFDDEGIPAQKVTLVEKGVLKTLLMSRRPRKEVAQSNGHGRAGTSGLPEPQVGNIIIRASQGLSEEVLKGELVRRALAHGLSFGVVIRALSNVAPQQPPMQAGPLPRQRVSPPVLVSRVYPDGREEPVRGLIFGDLSVKSLREIVAAGKKSWIDSGWLRPGGPVSSMAAPSVLFDELELESDRSPQARPSLLSNPYFESPPAR